MKCVLYSRLSGEGTRMELSRMLAWSSQCYFLTYLGLYRWMMDLGW